MIIHNSLHLLLLYFLLVAFGLNNSYALSGPAQCSLLNVDEGLLTLRLDLILILFGSPRRCTSILA